MFNVSKYICNKLVLLLMDFTTINTDISDDLFNAKLTFLPQIWVQENDFFLREFTLHLHLNTLNTLYLI